MVMITSTIFAFFKADTYDWNLWPSQRICSQTDGLRQWHTSMIVAVSHGDKITIVTITASFWQAKLAGELAVSCKSQSCDTTLNLLSDLLNDCSRANVIKSGAVIMFHLIITLLSDKVAVFKGGLPVSNNSTVWNCGFSILLLNFPWYLRFWR